MFPKRTFLLSVVLILFFFFGLQINVRVTTMDAELEFSFHPNTTGAQLFDQVCMLLCAKATEGPVHKSAGSLLGPLISAVSFCLIKFCSRPCHKI